ncbi:MAG: ABC transporter permease/substrate-binding protein [Myxococcales bacterium]|nr:MAG: ABC transporter permease/substrate-binding protein [Myxococcales bacterium]
MDNLFSQLPSYLSGHLSLTLTALLAGSCLSLPLGILATRAKWMERLFIGVASEVQTTPSLALLALMVPLLAFFALPNIGFLPAVIALTLYSILPILLGTVTAINGLDPAVLEAARAVGMSEWQSLRWVQLPLALPVIIAGIRTSAVWVVGTATLGTLVGATSLGNYILSGLQTQNYKSVLLGVGVAWTLVHVLDGIVRIFEKAVSKRSRSLLAVGVIAIVGLYGYTVSIIDVASAENGVREIKIGTKMFTEQHILGQILTQQIENQSDYKVRTLESLGTTVIFNALRSGSIDAYVSYTGTIWANHMKRSDRPQDRVSLRKEVKAYLKDEQGIVLLCPLGFENSYGLALRKDQALRLGLQTISELSTLSESLSVSGDHEFFARPEWERLREVYGLQFKQIRGMDSSLMYKAAANGSVDVIAAFTTDGRIDAFDLVLLRDDRQAFLPYDAIIMVNHALTDEAPGVVELLIGLCGSMNSEQMRRLNLSVDDGELEPEEAAKAFLDDMQ